MPDILTQQTEVTLQMQSCLGRHKEGGVIEVAFIWTQWTAKFDMPAVRCVLINIDSKMSLSLCLPKHL